MKRRTLDILFSLGGLAIAALLLVAGLVFTSNASFANTYVADQLGQQNITFTPADKLKPEEKEQACLVEYAGQKMTTGKQAECYANNYIGLHLKSIAGGETYASIGAKQTQLRTQVEEATKANAPNLADLQAQLATVNAQRDTLFRGETLRGLLLTSYGFSELGDKAGQAATVAYLGAGLMALLALFGFIHAFVTPKSQAFAAPEPETTREKVKA